ncbi:prepilin-type N-terminal cleavage/methylation domain-containing protein (plasmid) [Kozakia baliensis]|uniref:prepilin-type N-terminal cleavage/methylation domain-containing protein n=1 Tax=Kozakia baliensis TaxID=153496 RepID=UPI00345B9DC3
MQNKQADSGFTLIEIVVVLAVLSLVATIVIARGPLHSPITELRGAAQIVAGSFQQARLNALASGTVVILFIDPVRGVYGESRVDVQHLPAGIGFSPQSPRRIVFYPDGSASQGDVQLLGKSQSITMHIAWLTGAISMTMP